jgi:hypothetical protein
MLAFHTWFDKQRINPGRFCTVRGQQVRYLHQEFAFQGAFEGIPRQYSELQDEFKNELDAHCESRLQVRTSTLHRRRMSCIGSCIGSNTIQIGSITFGLSKQVRRESNWRFKFTMSSDDGQSVLYPS